MVYAERVSIATATMKSIAIYRKYYIYISNYVQYSGETSGVQVTISTLAEHFEQSYFVNTDADTVFA